ncbi:MAG: MATE family efflux transporter [Erysipelotrichaceae bacterium]|nr:MATE family efflux transporter [Erysipelotrichaceae bacterium]
MTNYLKKFFHQDTDMTEGNLFWKIILFALPIMLTQVMQLLYVTVDLTSVHYGDSAESMGAIASNSALINLIVVVFMGVSIGANVILSEAKGAKNHEKAEKVLHSSMIFAFITGIIVGVIGFFISDNLLELMGTEEHYFAKATLYLKIYFAGLPFLMIYNYSAQLLRAQGDSHSPFIALFVAGLSNIGLDLIFVFPLHMGVAGVALATIIAEAISAIICMLVLIFSKKIYVNFSFKKLKIDFPVLKEVLRVGIPAGLQGFFFSLPNVFIQSSLYTIDPGNVNLENGATASSNIEGYFYAIVDGIGVATMTFIAANIGAKKPDNIKKCILYGAIWGSIGCVIIGLVTGFLYRPLLSLFVTNEESIQAGRTRLYVMGLFYFFDFTMNYSGHVLRGMKRSTYPMVTTLLSCTVLRIILILTVFPLPYFHTIMWLYALFPITWVIATISNAIAMSIYIPKDLKVLRKIATDPAGPR